MGVVVAQRLVAANLTGCDFTTRLTGIVYACAEGRHSRVVFKRGFNLEEKNEKFGRKRYSRVIQIS